MKNKVAKTIKTWFVVSDIHGFFVELRDALRLAGYQKRNKEHGLIICGDIFDRGPDALAVYNFIQSIPKSRRILIRGNHELLYKELLEKDFPESHDFSNHTVDTFCQIAEQECQYDFDCIEEYFKYDGMSLIYSMYRGEPDETPVKQHWKKVLKVVKNHPITKFIFSDEWINYYELDNYILVHSWIPVGSYDGLPAYYIENRHFEYRDDWRNATQTEWDDSTWGCPWRMVKAGLNKTGKTIVCGHWHTSDFFKNLKNKTYETGQAPIYYSKDLIGIDCGVYTTYYGEYVHPQFVLVIKDGVCYDKFGEKLKEIKAVPIIETVPAKNL